MPRKKAPKTEAAAETTELAPLKKAKERSMATKGFTRTGSPRYHYKLKPHITAVVLTGEFYFKCPKCNELVPFADVGFRNMDNKPELRNEPNCTKHR